MIENTLGSLGSLMGLTLLVTMGLKPVLKFIPPRILAILIGEASTLLFWKAGIVTLDGADPATFTGWLLAGLYGLFAVSLAMKSHDFGSDPATAVKPVND